MNDIMAQTNALKYADLYVPVLVGREWKAKTPVGIITRRRKKDLEECCKAWREFAVTTKLVLKNVKSEEV
jgi:hypothetical protein